MKTIHLATAAAALLALAGCVAPPAAVYPAPGVATYASYCAAGVYQCPVPGNTPVGTSCACPGLGAPSYGVAQ